jgi:hypothetical protein
VKGTRVTDRPLAVQQQLMLDFIGTRVDDSYLNVEAFHVRGRLDIGRLRQALCAVLERHEVLRARFPSGRPVYEVLPMSAELIDRVFRWAPDALTLADAVAAGTSWVGRPMALDQEPPLRMWVCRVASEDTAVLFGGHYLVFDAWSFMLFYEDLAAEYEHPADDPERSRPPQYACVDAGANTSDTEDWSELFDREYRALRDLDRQATTRTGPAGVLRHSWDDLGEGLRTAARVSGVTPFVVGAAAMLGALSDLLGDPEVIVGSAYAGRATAASVRAIGYFATTIFFSADLDAPGGSAALLRRINDQLRRWHTSPRVQWQPLLARYQAADTHPAKFAFLPMDFARPQLVLDGLPTERLAPTAVRTARRPIDLLAGYDSTTITATLTYRRDVLDPDAAHTLVNRFGVRLREVCANAASR